LVRTGAYGADTYAVDNTVDAKVDPKLYLDDVKYLASPELKGRATGSPELETAARFLAAKYREFGVKPADGKSYLQSFPVTTSARPGPRNRFSFTGKGRWSSRVTASPRRSIATMTMRGST
jgi:hypothetical protein